MFVKPIKIILTEIAIFKNKFLIHFEINHRLKCYLKYIIMEYVPRHKYSKSPIRPKSTNKQKAKVKESEYSDNANVSLFLGKSI